MTRRELFALVPLLAMFLIGLAVVVPLVDQAHGALTPAADTEADVPDVALHPWDYLDGRHDAPEGSTGLVWDRAVGRWAWDLSPAAGAHVVLVAAYPEGPRAEVFAETYRRRLGVDQCNAMVAWLETRRDVRAVCILLGLER